VFGLSIVALLPWCRKASGFSLQDHRVEEAAETGCWISGGVCEWTNVQELPLSIRSPLSSEVAAEATGGGEQQPTAGEQQQGDEREGADTGGHCLLTLAGPASIPQ